MCASPQLENGYVKIANEIMEALARNRLSGQERQILDVILRKTYGFNKKNDTISMGQFSQYTGINRPQVAKLLKMLLYKKIIGVIQKDNSLVNSYYFSKDYENWQVLPKKITVIQKDNRVLSKKITEVLYKKIHTKDIYKDTSTKDTNIARAFIVTYCESFKALYGENPHISKKDAGIAKRLIKIPEIEVIMGRFFESNDKFIVQNRHALNIVESQINKLKVLAVDGISQWGKENIDETGRHQEV